MKLSRRRSERGSSGRRLAPCPRGDQCRPCTRFKLITRAPRPRFTSWQTRPETCGLALALEHTGDLYSCDHFVEPRHKLGNIRMTHLLELVDSPQQRQFGLDKREALPQYCLDCDVRFPCHGGCPKDRFISTPDGEPGLNYLCAGFKNFFRHVDAPMRTMGALLAQNRAPAEIMAQYASADAARGRNDPCTCGSCTKWKHCHGARVETAA